MPNTFLQIKLPAWSVREKKEREEVRGRLEEIREIKRVSQKNVRERERERERKRDKERKKERKKEM